MELAVYKGKEEGRTKAGDSLLRDGLKRRGLGGAAGIELMVSEQSTRHMAV
jgi:hypothetical protein